MICRVQESGDTVQGYSYSAGYCADIYASVIRGAVWTPQGGGTAPDITPPEGGITSVEYRSTAKVYQKGSHKGSCQF